MLLPNTNEEGARRVRRAPAGGAAGDQPARSRAGRTDHRQLRSRRVRPRFRRLNRGSSDRGCGRCALQRQVARTKPRVLRAESLSTTRSHSARSRYSKRRGHEPRRRRGRALMRATRSARPRTPPCRAPASSPRSAAGRFEGRMRVRRKRSPALVVRTTRENLCGCGRRPVRSGRDCCPQDPNLVEYRYPLGAGRLRRGGHLGRCRDRRSATVALEVVKAEAEARTRHRRLPRRAARFRP